MVKIKKETQEAGCNVSSNARRVEVWRVTKRFVYLQQAMTVNRLTICMLYGKRKKKYIK